VRPWLEFARSASLPFQRLNQFSKEKIMMKKYLSLCALCVSGAFLLAQTASAQAPPAAPKAKDKDKPAATAKDKPASKGKSGDTPRETRKPVTPDDSKDARDGAKDRAKEAREDAKDRTKDAKETAKDRTKDTREDAKDRAKDAKDTAKDARDDVKDRAKDTRDDVKDGAKDAKGTAKDREKDAKDTAKDTRDDVKDRAKSTTDRAKGATDRAKDTAKDRAKDARDDAKDVAKDSKDSKAGSKQARKFDAEKVKPADLGLSFKDADDGIAISNVEKNSVFVDSGFRSGDRIVSVNGQNITRQSDFISYLFAPDVVSVGRVPVVVMRGGARETIYVQPATIIRNYETVVYQDRRNPIRDFGLVVDGRNDDRVYVERVIKDSRADHAGIQVDDQILAVNEQQVETRNDLARLLEKYEDERIDMEVRRDREAKLIEVKVIR
jgi:C-terminal processing protease CtpA/Prc